MEESMDELFGVELNWTAILTTALCVISAYILLKCFWNQQMQDKVLKARVRRDTTLQRAEQAVRHFKETHHGKQDTAEILSLPLAELTKCLRTGSLTPETVLHTYMEKALEVNKKLNCCTGVLLESLEQCKTVASHKEGLLYGVPVSIKENLGYKGHDSTCGVVCRLDQPATEDSVVVQVLKKQGAIPYVKTNVPQGLLNYDCSNPVYGQTINPRHPGKTCGGSSGGEGALIGGGGSLLGIGTDIGGSIRIPASFCGVCGLKPTTNRLSSRGASSCARGQKSVSSALGPLARDVDSLVLLMQALLCDTMFTLDPTVPPIPFNQQVYSSTLPLKIGWFENDGYTYPSPSMARALRETKTLLEDAGHTLVPFTLPRLTYAMHELVLKGLLADAGSTLLSNLEGAPVDPILRPQTIPYSLPNFVKKILSVLLKPLFPRIASSLSCICGVGSVSALWKQHAAVEDYTHEFISEWRRKEMDVLLCPMLGPAYNFYYCGKLTCAVSYTIMYNLLNCPAGCVPVSSVTAADIEQLKHYKGNYGDPWDKFFKQAVTGAEGLPVAVQCVALPWQEELCLRLMKEVETLTRNKRK